NQLIITRKEYDLLSNHLKLSSRLSDFNKDKLHNELKSAKIVTKDNLPEDAIVLDSLVTIQDEETAQEFTFHLVTPEEANMRLNKLSVLAPIGIALLGYTSGARVDWEMPTGVKKFKIIKVSRFVSENDKEIA
ncbi:transcription elongation factor GreA, partial [Pedobacter sp. HMWF019]|uniref:GreA/GreB family elongation factor n=1 Tax=Pedobacter sp. HMWF019 TaxID=2056856 RepID=UPI000D34133C